MQSLPRACGWPSALWNNGKERYAMKIGLLIAAFKQVDREGFTKLVSDIPVICSDLKLGQMMFIDANLAKLPDVQKTVI